jgi:hypothetical protein
MKNGKLICFTGLSLKFSSFRFFKRSKFDCFNYNQTIFSELKKLVQISFVDFH